ncbi:DNA-binding protein [Candidatus Dojkabacteria bacterium]|uniref:DNA-binding protein n=1 Tax=Candidatus Dojkabacteria bacterium TaxID=2099670 RepID=A0A955L437_9BACT|nr:DNA-binding protein [Candidatus Dojkabacteria bacterium]
MKVHVFRLHPGELLREEIEKFVANEDIDAGIILTCCGNLSKAVIRMADANIVKTYDGTFEILSLAGTVEKGDCHLHITISDKDGNAFGGHLKQGSIVGVTAEIAIGELDKYKFKREFDERTGYKELVVEKS